jgi:hypothetical protein
MTRKRIVIDLDPARGGANQPRGSMHEKPRAAAGDTRGGIGRVLIVIGVVLLVLAGGIIVGAYVWWRHYQSTPAYSLALLADASQRNDTAAVDSLLDTEKVTDDFVSQVRQRVSGATSLPLPSTLPGPLGSAVPIITPKLRQIVHDEFVKEVQRLTEPAAGKPFILVALSVSYFADIREENKIARVAVNIKDEHLEFTMRPDGDRWRIVAVQDDKLAKLIADAVIRNMPTRRPQIEDEIQKQWEKLTAPGSVSRHIGSIARPSGRASLDSGPC